MGKKNCSLQAAHLNSTRSYSKRKQNGSLDKSDNLTGIFTNADTQTNKMTELLALIKEHNPDIIGVNEVLPKFFKHKIYPEEFLVENYEMIVHPNVEANRGRVSIMHVRYNSGFLS